MSDITYTVARLSTAAKHAIRDLQRSPRPHPPVGAARPVGLTVGIATHDDFHGAYFTISSLLIHHRDQMADTEIVILDNNPRGPEAAALARIASDAGALASIRYVPYEDVESTAVRDVLFREAAGDTVLVLDSHVLLDSGSLAALRAYFDDPGHASDMVQGPMLAFHGEEIVSTQMNPTFNRGMFGQWGLDERARDPKAPAFDIPSQGLAVFAMRKHAWPGLNPRFRGFGAEEGYVQEKVRQAGGRTVCLPALRWQHRFLRPAGTSYPNTWSDRLNNYYAGWAEIGYDPDLITAHFHELLGEALAADQQRLLADLEHASTMADGLVVVSDDDRVAPWRRTLPTIESTGAPFIRAAFGEDVDRRFDGADAEEEAATTLVSPGVALARALDRARYRGWRSAIVIDETLRADEVLFAALERAAGDHPEAAVVAISSPVGAAALMRALPDADLTGPWLASLDATEVSFGVSPLRATRTAAQSPLAQIVIVDSYGNTTLWHRAHRVLERAGTDPSTITHLPMPSYAALDLDQSISETVRVWLTDRPAIPEHRARQFDGPVLLMRDDAVLLRGHTDMIAHAIAEADAADHARPRPAWELLALDAAPSAAHPVPVPGTALLVTRQHGHLPTGVVVHPAAAERLRAALHEGSTLADILNDDSWRVFGVWPPPVSLAEYVRGQSEQARLRHRYERP